MTGAMAACRATAAALAVLLLAPHLDAGAQETGIRAVGQVRDSAGTPVAGALVTTPGYFTRSDSAGKFSLTVRQADSTTITVQRLGFQAVTFTVETVTLLKNDLDVELIPVARRLAEIEVAEQRNARVPAMEAFNQRRVTYAGSGSFFTREELELREGQRLSAILREAPGVQIMSPRGSPPVLRFSRWMQGSRDCPPFMFLDGMLVRGLEIDDVATSHVAGVELYPTTSSAPGIFSAGREVSSRTRSGCGVVVIWTRRPILER